VSKLWLTTVLASKEASADKRNASINCNGGLELVNCNPIEQDISQRINSASWAGPLSLDQYLRREKHIANQDLTKDGGISHWQLIDPAVNGHLSEDPTKARAALSTCETIKKKALFAFVNKEGKIEVEDVWSHGIGSVFCAANLRGKGYAKRMMEALGQKVQKRGVEDGEDVVFTVLYSDVGKVRDFKVERIRRTDY
jgi:GNAT superfamily N-acetyltransferase